MGNSDAALQYQEFRNQLIKLAVSQCIHSGASSCAVFCIARSAVRFCDNLFLAIVYGSKVFNLLQVILVLFSYYCHINILKLISFYSRKFLGDCVFSEKRTAFKYTIYIDHSQNRMMKCNIYMKQINYTDKIIGK